MATSPTASGSTSPRAQTPLTPQQQLDQLQQQNAQLQAQLQLLQQQQQQQQPRQTPSIQKLSFRADQTFDKADKKHLRPEFFLRGVEDQLQLARATEQDSIAAVSQILRGTSLAWWNTRRLDAVNPIITWNDFRVAYLAHSADAGRDARRRSAYENCRQQSGETFQSYALRFQEAQLLHPEPPEPHAAAFHLRDGISGELKAAVRLEIAAHRLRTVPEIVAFGESWDAEKDAEAHHTRSVKQLTNPSPMDVGSLEEIAATAVIPLAGKRSHAEQSAALNKVQKLCVTLTDLRKGKRLDRLSPNVRNTLRTLGVCTRCRVGFHQLDWFSILFSLYRYLLKDLMSWRWTLSSICRKRRTIMMGFSL